MSKNIVEPERLQTVWRMRFACWISKAVKYKSTLLRLCIPPPSPLPPPTHTHKYVILIFFPTATIASMLRYTYIACLFQNDLPQQYHNLLLNTKHIRTVHAGWGPPTL
jgi:hypothetical protein